MSTTTALVLVDIQNDYWRAPREPRPAFVETARSLLEFARGEGLFVVHVQHATRKPDSHTFRPGTPGYDIHECVAPLPDEARIVKRTPGSFFGTNLDAVLRSAGIEEVVIAGMQTQHCCDTTTREASALGYRPLFVTDAVETFDLTGPSGDRVDRDDINRITFATLSNGFATVLSFADLRATFAPIKA
jgi:nicotinamidase-related amidase